MNLEEQLARATEWLNIKEKHRQKISLLLQQLKNHHLQTYEHAIRVGLTSKSIAQFMHLDPKPAIYGVLHDLGKARIPLQILEKTEEFNEQDMEMMKNHVQWGYEMLQQEGYIFSSWIALTHHRYQKNQYPRKLPQKPAQFCEGTKLLVDIYSRIVSLADQNDALKQRNDRYGTIEMKASRSKEIMLTNNYDQEYLIKELYEARILT